MMPRWRSGGNWGAGDINNMPRKRKTPEERLADLQHKQSMLQGRIQKEKARVRTMERKADTRRKIVAGAIVLEHALHDERFGEYLEKLLARHVTRPQDRVLFELPPLPQTRAAQDQEAG
ncbi:MAG: mobilization protein [Pseudomonadota bacterium]